jgi:hypothetical protein
VSVESTLTSDLKCVAFPLVRLGSLPREQKLMEIKTPPFLTVTTPMPRDQTDRYPLPVRILFDLTTWNWTHATKVFPYFCSILHPVPIVNVIWYQFHVHDKMDLQVWLELEPKPSIKATFVLRQNLREHSDNLEEHSDTVFRSATIIYLQHSNRAIVRRSIKTDG